MPRKKKLAPQKNSKKAARYAPAQRTKILARYQELLASGMKTSEAAKKVGVSYLSLRKWQKTGSEGPVKKPVKPASLKSVKKPGRKPGRKPAPKPGKAKLSGRGELVTLTTPQGYTIEGLSREDVVAIIKAIK